MNDEQIEHFPSLEDLKTECTARANAVISRVQTVASMAREFCRKMEALHLEPGKYEVAGGTKDGYIIPVRCTGEDGSLVEGRLFVATDGYFGDFVDDKVGIPNARILRSDEMVDAYRQAMLNVLSMEEVQYGPVTKLPWDRA